MKAEGTPSDTRLRGRWLLVARVAWITIVALAAGLYVASIPSQIALRETLCSGSACTRDQISLDDLQQLQQAGISLHADAVFFVVINTIFVLVFLIVAAIIFWRRSNEGIGLFASLALATFGVSFSGALETLGAHYPALLLPTQLVDVFGRTSMDVLFLVFPNGRFVPRWAIGLVPVVAAREAINVFAPSLLSLSLAYAFPLMLGLIAGAQIYRYVRVSNGIERQQTKWTLAGMSVGVVSFGVLITLGASQSGDGQSGGLANGLANLIASTALYVFLMLIPLSIGMAILRSHLWDIDILIRRTLIYGVLTGLLVLVYLGAVIALQALFTALTGQQRSELVTVLSTLVIAALFVPLRNRVQALIDRRFYRRKYDAARTLAQFGAALRDEVNLDDLSAHLLTTVDETMQPASVGLWLKTPEREVKP